MSLTRIVITVGLSIFLIACASTQEQRQNNKIAESNVNLGVGYFQQGKVEAALEKMKKAIEAQYDYPEAHGSIAVIYQQLNEDEKAREHYETAISLQPGNGDFQNNYATLLCKLGEYKEAEIGFMKAINSRGYRTPAQAYENLGSCMMKKQDFVKAEKYLRTALQINPKLSKALLQMARVGLIRKNYMSGRAYMQRYQEVAEMNPESLQLGIEIEKKIGDMKTVMEYESQLRRKFPDSHETKKLIESEYGKKAK